MTSPLLETLAHEAIVLDAKVGTSTVKTLFEPTGPDSAPALDSAFVIARLVDDTPGFAYGKLDRADSDCHNISKNTPAEKLISDIGNSGRSRARALATVNAVLNRHSAHCLAGATAPPPTVVPFDQPQQIGMVGYFQSLVPTLLNAGHRVQVVELDSTLWQNANNLIVAPDHALLEQCDTVLCTATVLLNDSLHALRSAARQCSRFVLLGPSVPLAPETLAHQGVTHLAGRAVPDATPFWAACESGRPWSPYTQKFLLDTKKASTR